MALLLLTFNSIWCESCTRVGVIYIHVEFARKINETCRWNKARRMLIINTFALNTLSRREKWKIDCVGGKIEPSVEERIRVTGEIWRSLSTIQFANKSSLLCCHRRKACGGRSEVATLINRLQSQPKPVHSLAIFHFVWARFISCSSN